MQKKQISESNFSNINNDINNNNNNNIYNNINNNNNNNNNNTYNDNNIIFEEINEVREQPKRIEEVIPRSHSEETITVENDAVARRRLMLEAAERRLRQSRGSLDE